MTVDDLIDRLSDLKRQGVPGDAEVAMAPDGLHELPRYLTAADAMHVRVGGTAAHGFATPPGSDTGHKAWAVAGWRRRSADTDGAEVWLDC